MYKVIAVDDEMLSLKRFEHIIQKENRIKLKATFSDGNEALEFIKNNVIDIAFLDIEMPDINGLELAERIFEIDPLIRIIFVTAFDQYALDAFKAHAIGYLLKPLDINELSKQIDSIEKTTSPREESQAEIPETVIADKRLIVRYLGQNACYTSDNSDELISFRTAKTAELFAFLIQQYRTPVGKYAILDALFPDADYEKSNKLFYVSCSYIRSTFQKHGFSNILIRENDNYRLNTAFVDCDYISILENERNLSSLTIPELSGLADLCNGEYLLGKSYEWSFESKAYMETLSRRVLFALSDKYIAENDFENAVLPLEKNLIIDPYNEDTVEKLIILYKKNNLMPKARALYQNFSARLLDYSGSEPSSHIKELIK